MTTHIDDFHEWLESRCPASSDHSADAGKKVFSLVFRGDLQRFPGNPFATETAFGAPFRCGYGDAFEEAQLVQERMDAALDALTEQNIDGSYVYPEFVRNPIVALLTGVAT